MSLLMKITLCFLVCVQLSQVINSLPSPSISSNDLTEQPLNSFSPLLDTNINDNLTPADENEIKDIDKTWNHLADELGRIIQREISSLTIQKIIKSTVDIMRNEHAAAFVQKVGLEVVHFANLAQNPVRVANMFKALFDHLGSDMGSKMVKIRMDRLRELVNKKGIVKQVRAKNRAVLKSLESPKIINNIGESFQTVKALLDLSIKNCFGAC